QVTESKPLAIIDFARHLFPEPWQQQDYFLVLSEVLGYLDWAIERNLISTIHESGKVWFQN
ncbi:MAG: hypothetical protein ACFCU6_09660, partial [Balneolaceae bacterium]